MRLLVCGDRNWTNRALVYEQVRSFAPSLVIHGAARGADTIGGDVAKLLNVPVQVYPAQWATHGRAAGPIRNQQMLDEGKPDYVLAFHNDIFNSKGTKDMLNRAKKAGVPCTLVTE